MICVTDAELEIILKIQGTQAPKGGVRAFGSRQRRTPVKHSGLAVAGNADNLCPS
ncbi:MAG: hypothetical protein LBP22_03700 [Deltaproteobacteria bacterium]|jgi:hypothetical protein|nr:hypothetical protein [Deltaproteobacteria bacterium]